MHYTVVSIEDKNFIFWQGWSEVSSLYSPTGAWVPLDSSPYFNMILQWGVSQSVPASRMWKILKGWRWSNWWRKLTIESDSLSQSFTNCNSCLVYICCLQVCITVMAKLLSLHIFKSAYPYGLSAVSTETNSQLRCYDGTCSNYREKNKE